MDEIRSKKNRVVLEQPERAFVHLLEVMIGSFIGVALVLWYMIASAIFLIIK